MSAVEILQIACLRDNYAFVIHDPESRQTALIDTPEAAPILAATKARGWAITHIFNTHHHPDHVGGNLAIKAASGCRILGPASEAAAIPGLDETLAPGQEVELGRHRFQVLDAKGHTLGQIAYWSEEDALLFCGDALFSLGCGRLFEGTAEEAWASLLRLRALPDETRVYCAHEYSAANARFALSLEPDNPHILEKQKEILALRDKGLPSVPFLLGPEKRANPFLRADDPLLQEKLGLVGEDPVRVFAAIRARKDRF